MESRPWHRHYDYCVPTTIRIPQIPVAELLQIPAAAHPDKAALYFMDLEMSFGELRQQVLRMANVLVKMGVRKGDRVGIQLPNCPQYIIAYYGTLSVGAIVVNMNPLYTVAELSHIAEITELAVLITLDQAVPVIQALCKQVRIPRVFVTRISDHAKRPGGMTSAGLDLEKGWHHFSTLLDDISEAKRVSVKIVPEDPAVIQFTGGTTGVPKGAILTHANLVAATFQLAFWESPITQLTPIERRNVLGVLPFTHVYGNIVTMNWAMLNCATMILVSRFQIDEFMDLMAKFKKIHIFPAVPTMINAVINHPKAKELDLARKLTMLTSGGAPMPVEMIEQIKDMGIYFAEGYGLSESSALGICNPFMGLKKDGSIGIPLPDNDVRLVDLDTGEHDVPLGQPGEIIMKGPLIMQAYWRNPKETAEQIRNGWLHTGDIAVRDEDGYLFIVDRKKDIIIAGGYNIYPREIDEVLLQHRKIQDAISVGIPDQYRGETVKAYLVLKPGETATEAEILAFCKERLAPYKVPKIVEFRSSLPRSAVGKALRKILRAEEEEKAKKP